MGLGTLTQLILACTVNFSHLIATILLHEKLSNKKYESVKIPDELFVVVIFLQTLKEKENN